MRPVLLALLLALATALSTQSAAPPTPPSPRQLAVARALDYLHKAQQTSGTWKPASTQAQVPVTALALLAFFSAGHAPGKGPHGEVIEKGLRALIKAQQSSGWLAENRGSSAMYGHAMATMALAQAHDQTTGALREEIGKALDKALEFTFTAQRKTGSGKGGWRYQPTGYDGDLSITGWQILALCAAREAGRKVPAEKLEQALAYVRTCRDPRTGAFRYTLYGPATHCCTANGVIALTLLSKDGADDADLPKAEAWLAANRIALETRYPHEAAFLASSALALRGGAGYPAYRKAIEQLLLPRQDKSGGWTDRRATEAFLGGPSCTTAFAVLALTAEDQRLLSFRKPSRREK